MRDPGMPLPLEMPVQDAGPATGWRHPLAWGLLVSGLAHAALLAMNWHAAPQRVPQRAARADARLVVRMVAAPVPVPQAMEPTPVPQARAATPRRARTATKAAPRRAAPAVPPEPAASTATAAPAPVPAAPVAAVFGLPRIGFGGPSPTRWMSAPAAAMPAPPPLPPPDPTRIARALRDAGRQQLLAVLAHQSAQWPQPENGHDGACRLQPQAALQCDTPALQQALAPQADPLAGLLDAYRGLEPRTQALDIDFRDGRYRVSVSLAR
jgi:hypothetical protein